MHKAETKILTAMTLAETKMLTAKTQPRPGCSSPRTRPRKSCCLANPDLVAGTAYDKAENKVEPRQLPEVPRLKLHKAGKGNTNPEGT